MIYVLYHIITKFEKYTKCARLYSRKYISINNFPLQIEI